MADSKQVALFRLKGDGPKSYMVRGVKYEAGRQFKTSDLDLIRKLQEIPAFAVELVAADSEAASKVTAARGRRSAKG